MKENKGNPSGLKSTNILRITHSPNNHRKEKSETALILKEDGFNGEGFVISSAENKGKDSIQGLFNVPSNFINTLKEGDIVKIEPDGRLTVLFETSSRYNALFLTDFCNSRCIMCPQKHEENPKNHYEDTKRMLELINSTNPPAFGITGGEPALLADELSEILSICRKRFPDSPVQLLTNGRCFSDFRVANKVSEQSPRRLMLCIPIFADNETEHDFITDREGSFRETIKGIHNILRFGLPIEIRVVIVRQNSERLGDLANFIFWNFPFALHVTFMAMETSGVAATNIDNVWVEPMDYAKELEKAILFLNQRMMNVSIYNLPLCLLPENLHKFARDSISEWKKTYLPECSECKKRESCGGFFATSMKKPAGIKPFKQKFLAK